MRPVLFIIVSLLFSSALPAEESVTLPLTEYKTLYRDSIEQDLDDLSAKEPVPAFITIEKADYQLKVGDVAANGRITLSGSLVQGKPGPLPLFDDDIAVTKFEAMEGGHLISRSGRYCFLSDGSDHFSLQMQVSLAVEEDAKSRFLSFSIPQAVQNSLQLDSGKDEQLLAMPGVQTMPGLYHFSPREKLELRFKKPQPVKTVLAPVIDTFTRISHRDKHLLLTSYFTPLRNLDQAIRVQAPAGARYLESNLKPSWIKSNTVDNIQVRLPLDKPQPFFIRYELPLEANTDEHLLTLVHVDGNRGREGEFTLEQPVDRELSLAGSNVTSNLSPDRLPSMLREMAEVSTPYTHFSGEGTISLQIKKYQSVPVPEIVLDSLRFFAIFDDSGSVMSTLRIKVPAQAGDRLQVKPIPDAELWSVTVNGKPQSMFSLDSGMWIVPIQPGQKSLVEVKFLQAGEPLGIQGRLHTLVPDTGLTARYIQVAIALPKRVELVSLDADLAPADKQSWVSEKDYTGQAYYFSRAFYKGQALDLAVYYKEWISQQVGATQ